MAVRTNVNLDRPAVPFALSQLTKPNTFTQAEIRDALGEWGIASARICQQLPSPQTKPAIFIENPTALQHACVQRLDEHHTQFVGFSWLLGNEGAGKVEDDQHQFALSFGTDDALTWSCSSDELGDYLSAFTDYQHHLVVKDLAQVGALFPKLPLESIGGCLRSAWWLREPGEEYREAQHHQSANGSVSLPQRAELIRTEFLGVNSSLSENNLDSYYIEKELPYRKALAALNRQGIPFNAGCFNEFCDDLHQQS